jgi:hypothetical protein
MEKKKEKKVVLSDSPTTTQLWLQQGVVSHYDMYTCLAKNIYMTGR